MKSVGPLTLTPPQERLFKALSKHRDYANWNTTPQTILIAYQEFIHARLTLLKIDPFNCHLLLLWSAEGCLHHCSCSTPCGWKRWIVSNILRDFCRKEGQTRKLQVPVSKDSRARWKSSEGNPTGTPRSRSVQLRGPAQLQHWSAGLTKRKQVDLYEDHYSFADKKIPDSSLLMTEEWFFLHAFKRKATEVTRTFNLMHSPKVLKQATLFATNTN